MSLKSLTIVIIVYFQDSSLSVEEHSEEVAKEIMRSSSSYSAGEPISPAKQYNCPSTDASPCKEDPLISLGHPFMTPPLVSHQSNVQSSNIIRRSAQESTASYHQVIYSQQHQHFHHQESHAFSSSQRPLQDMQQTNIHGVSSNGMDRRIPRPVGEIILPGDTHSSLNSSITSHQNSPSRITHGDLNNSGDGSRFYPPFYQQKSQIPDPRLLPRQNVQLMQSENSTGYSNSSQEKNNQGQRNAENNGVRRPPLYRPPPQLPPTSSSLQDQLRQVLSEKFDDEGPKSLLMHEKSGFEDEQPESLDSIGSNSMSSAMSSPGKVHTPSAPEKWMNMSSTQWSNEQVRTNCV